MAATPTEIKAELLLRFPGSDDLTLLGTLVIPLKIVGSTDDHLMIAPDLSGFERIANAYNEES